MQLHQFQPNVGGSEAYSIKAKQLDDNFAMLQVKSNGTYGINEDRDGYTLEIFPAFPTRTRKPLCLMHNGKQAGTPDAPTEAPQVGLQWIPVSAAVFAAPSISAGAHFVANGNNGAAWTYPPSGQPLWRQVERCDGKKMWVWGTDWED